ncbi:MAG: extracellular solute-binding protein [Candidatus Sumerlaeia bacterium]|nr:extracellular solute-binding protein [Candidatus Sumerlaeia bacterium]
MDKAITTARAKGGADWSAHPHQQHGFAMGLGPLALWIALLLLSPLASANLLHASTTNEQPTGQITVWAMGDEAMRLPMLARRFEQENPGTRIRVQAIPWNGAHQRLITSVAGNVTPDVAQLGTTWVPEFAAMDALLPLDEYLEASTLSLDQFFDGSARTTAYDGQVVSIPWYVDTRVFFYRTDLAREAGWEHFPRNWEEMIAFGHDLTRDINGDGRIDQYAYMLPTRGEQELLPFIRQAGADLIDDVTLEVLANTPEMAEALGFYQSMFDLGFAPAQGITALGPHQSMARGTFVSFISGPWFVGMIQRDLPDLAGKWSVAPMPSHRRSSSFLGGSNLGVFRGSNNPDLAWAFIEFCSRPDIQADWYREVGNLPATREAWNSPELHGDPLWDVFRRQLEVAEPTPSLEFYKAIEDLLRNQQETLILSGRDPSDVAAAIAGGLERIVSMRRVGEGNIARHFPIIISLLLLGVVGLGIYFYQRRQMFVGFSKYKTPYLFLLPIFIHLGVFLFLPILASLFMSFTNFDIYSINNWSNTSFVGLENYSLLLSDPLVAKALFNTLYFMLVGGPLTVILALLLAICLNSALLPAKSFFRSGIFLPVVTPLVAVAVVWRWIYAPRDGILNQVLVSVGLPEFAWLQDTNLALPSLIAMSVWKNVGFGMVIFLAGLQSIPRTFYEACEIDGATRFQTFLHITVPLLRPTLLFVVIITTIGYMQFFAEPFIMTDKGGPENSTLSIVLLLYNEGFDFFRMGYASAIAYTLFVFIALISLFQIRYAKGEDFD